MVSRREQDPYVPIAGMAGAVAKILTQAGGAGNDCLNLNFRQNFP